MDARVIEHVFLYFGLVAVVCVTAWFGLMLFEPDNLWTSRSLPAESKLLDCASAVAATVNGVGPGLGVVGATQNYALLHPCSKLICTALMLLGRLEFIPLLVLCVPAFWRRMS